MRLPSPVLWLLLGGKGSRIPLLRGGEGRGGSPSLGNGSSGSRWEASCVLFLPGLL